MQCLIHVNNQTHVRMVEPVVRKMAHHVQKLFVLVLLVSLDSSVKYVSKQNTNIFFEGGMALDFIILWFLFYLFLIFLFVFYLFFYFCILGDLLKGGLKSTIMVPGHEGHFEWF